MRLNLNKVEGALDDAKKCLALDPSFVKAHHRKAQALLRLGDFDEAIQAAQEGAKLEPENKSFQELIDKAQKDKEKDRIETDQKSSKHPFGSVLKHHVPLVN